MTRSQRNFTWVAAIAVAIILIIRGVTLYTDYLWMDSVGQAAVFAKLLWTRLALGLAVGVLFFFWLWGNLRLARRPQPQDVTLIGKRLLPEEDRQQIESFAGRALLIFAVIGALYAGLQAGGQAMPLLQFLNPAKFGQTDPLFHKDAGFYVFQLPFVLYLYHTIMSAIVITLVACVLVHLYQENVRIVGNGLHANPWARRHLLGLLSLALIFKIWGYRLAQYNLLYSNTGERFWGASYTDVTARLPVLWIMMVIALGAAVLCILTIPRRDFRLAGWSLGVLVVLSLVGGTVYPWAIQRLVVIPNQLRVEEPYLKNNIAATRTAFDLEDLHRTTYTVRREVSRETLERSRQTLKSIRLWDYRPLEATFDMRQALRSYYTFPGVDVDRYHIDGELRQVSISLRQLDYSKVPGGVNWQNQHLIYTHGYGAVVSPIHEADAYGLPFYWVGGLPPISTVPQLDIKRAGIYYQSEALPPLIELVSSPESLQPAQPQGEAGPPGPAGPGPAPALPVAAGSPLAKTPPGEVPYVLVNTRQPELDYPSVDAPSAGNGDREENVMTKYSGPGGVQLKNFWRRLCFAIRFGDLQILLTNYITPESRIQLNRYVPSMLVRIAAFLQYDPDPYPMIAEDGTIKWICDAYTISNRYPYSTLASAITAEKLALPGWNYMRNSVKVVVDAYDGVPTYYIVDPKDPMAQCYSNIFPTLFTSQEEMPPDVRRHLRYPLLQFMMQAKVYGLYHMDNAETFFTREDMWTIPPEIIHGTTQRPMEPYYIVMKLPGAEKEQYILMLPYVLKGREERVAVAWMAAICDEPDYGKLVVYDFPKNTAVTGPMQFEGMVDQSPEISAEFTLWGQGGSQVTRGNTLMIPVDGSLLYIEPIYLISTEKNATPQLQRVIASYGERIVMEPTLDAALTKLFGVDLKLAAGGPAKMTAEGGMPEAPPAAPGSAAGPEAPAIPAAAPAPAPAGDTQELIRQANQAYAEGEAALRQGDLTTYQAKMKQVGEILGQLKTGQ
ncbi:MAG: UPF0182 family protein [candidate division WS1 bacterium]|nr:UPF0182 family protein [candidate division WS1 bacterium]